MLFVIDVGNTNIVLGVYKNDELLNYWRMRTDKDRSSDEYGMFFINLFNHHKINVKEIDGIAISSVVPPIMYSLEHSIKKYFKKVPVVVGPGVKTGINIKYDNPREVGADRIVNAVAAYEKYKGPLIIVDFGTATTYCAVSKNGEYIGGIISPGIKVSLESLFIRTAKLPRVEIVKPDTVIGKNTVNSMQSGIIYGYVGQVEYLVKKMKKEMKEDNIKVIATGGLATVMANETQAIDYIDGLLTLEGLKIIYYRNK